MATDLRDLFLRPGDLAALFASRGIDVSAESPLAGLPLLASSESARSVTEIATAAETASVAEIATVTESTPEVDSDELNVALEALARPSLVIAGLRGVRRMEPWPFFLCRRTGGGAVILAPEGDGCARLRFPYSDEALVDWLAGPLRRFAAPEIPCAEIPALTASGIAVMLALADLFRHRYPDLDPDWIETEPITFTSEEVMAIVTAGAEGREPSSLMRGLARLGGPKPEALSLETVEALLYMFANEGYLELDITTATPLFTMTDPFLGTPLSLAWWDMSFSLESRLGCVAEPIRVMQGLALWRCITGSDNRTRMKAVSGEEVEAEIRALVSPAAIASAATPPVAPAVARERSSPLPPPVKRSVPVPLPPAVVSPAPPAPPATAPTPAFCGKCGTPRKPEAKFCGSCGTLTAAKTDPQACAKCGRPRKAGARFCAGCGAPA